MQLKCLSIFSLGELPLHRASLSPFPLLPPAAFPQPFAGGGGSLSYARTLSPRAAQVVSPVTCVCVCVCVEEEVRERKGKVVCPVPEVEVEGECKLSIRLVFLRFQLEALKA